MKLALYVSIKQESELCKRYANENGKSCKGQKKRRKHSLEDNNLPAPLPLAQDDINCFFYSYYLTSCGKDMMKSCKTKRTTILCLKYVSYTN